MSHKVVVDPVYYSVLDYLTDRPAAGPILDNESQFPAVVLPNKQLEIGGFQAFIPQPGDFALKPLL